jgi:hypothetical protein
LTVEWRAGVDAAESAHCQDRQGGKAPASNFADYDQGRAGTTPRWVAQNAKKREVE